MKSYIICCIAVLGLFIYGSNGEEPIIEKAFNEVEQEILLYEEVGMCGETIENLL